MPKSMVIKAVKDTNFKGKKILTDYIKVGTISKIFNVSIEAATYRLEGLGIIEKDIVDIHNYTEAFVNLCS
jgi:Zn-dependent peptidase ImmA (M78 family)